MSINDVVSRNKDIINGLIIIQVKCESKTIFGNLVIKNFGNDRLEIERRGAVVVTYSVGRLLKCVIMLKECLAMELVEINKQKMDLVLLVVPT